MEANQASSPATASAPMRSAPSGIEVASDARPSERRAAASASRRVAHRHAGKARKLEGVGCHDIGQRQQRVGHGLGNAALGIGAAIVAEHRIEAIERARIGALHPAHGIGHDPSLLGLAQIAGENGIAAGKPAIGLEPADQARHQIGRDRLARHSGVAGMAGELDRRHRPDLMAEALQREAGRALADMAIDDFGLEREHIHDATLAGNLAGPKPWGRCRRDRYRGFSMTAAIRPRRSVLYMPGSNARALEKARSLPADALILDLEDAVAPDAKELARTQVCEAVKARGFGKREVVIRINALPTAWGEADLAAAAAAGPDAILVPKVSTPQELADVERRLGDAKVALWAMVETPLAILNIAAIAAAGGRLACFVMGTNDLIKEFRGEHTQDRQNLSAALSLSVAAARAYGLAVIDGVYNDIQNADGFARVLRTGPRLRLRRQDPDPSLARSTPATLSSRRPPKRWSMRARSSPPSNCRRTKARARSRSTGAWWNCCMPRSRARPWRWPTPSRHWSRHDRKPMPAISSRISASARSSSMLRRAR